MDEDPEPAEGDEPGPGDDPGVDPDVEHDAGEDEVDPDGDDPDGDDPGGDDPGGDDPDGGAGGVSSWVRRAEVIGWGLLAVIVVLLLGTLAEAIAAGSRQGSLLARMGAAFVGQAGTSDGLALLAAAGLACWARARRLLMASLVLALLVCVATPVAMLGDVSNVRHVHEPVNALLRWELLTFFGVTFIPAALAAAVAWWGREDGLARPGTDI